MQPFMEGWGPSPIVHSGRDLDVPGPGPGSRTFRKFLAGPGPAAKF